MADPGQRLIGVLLDRVYASLVSGPLMNCRPHSSRQRIDLFQLGRLPGADPSAVVATLLGSERSVKLLAPSGTMVANSANGVGDENSGGSGKDELRGLFSKLRTITEDARTYEEDTGTQALFLGFPLLNLPPETAGGGAKARKRILAPLAFIPLQLTVKATRPVSVTLEAVGEGADLVVPNSALVAWVERITGNSIGELFADEEGTDPWGELNELVSAVAKALELPVPPAFAPGGELLPTPKAEAETAAGVLPAAVIGLFPAAKQGLLNDLEALSAGERASGPIESFLKAGAELGQRQQVTAGDAPETQTSLAGSERCISQVDPCQARAVHLARQVNGLVIHGPPGTGKSQTITNIIGDHLANGERVLFVCDKRTALDVVAYRLRSLGLGSLCAVVHDARRDQRELYRSIREQLDELNQVQARPGSVVDLERVDQEVVRIHGELAEFEQALAERPGGVEPSFHELVGEAFKLRSPLEVADAPELRGIELGQLLSLEGTVKEVIERGAREQFPSNPWRASLEGSLQDFLSRPHAEWETRVRRVVEAARQLTAVSGRLRVPFSEADDAQAEGQARAELGGLIRGALELTTTEALAKWATADSSSAASAAADVEASGAQVELLKAPPDRELGLTGAAPAATELALWIGRLASYLEVAKRWDAFFYFGRRGAAREILERFGLTLNPEAAERVSAFLKRLQARKMLENLASQLRGNQVEGVSEAELVAIVTEYTKIFQVVGYLQEHPDLKARSEALRRQLATPGVQQELAIALCADGARGKAIVELEQALKSVGLLSEAVQRAVSQRVRRGESVVEQAEGWLHSLSSVEGLLRMQALLHSLVEPLAKLLRELLDKGVSPDDAWKTVRVAVLKGEIHRRLQTQPVLATTDGDRVESLHRRYRELNAVRRELVRDLAHHVWVARQRERLLASTGSRLNSTGAEVRRRLVTRGKRAMRVRQMIAAGAGLEGRDPVFDLRPVWMASPDVVAQVFPRDAVFDVVIFDEASQCRLEDGLPVLLRAKRVVIAGDPQQLPPTRFFESGVAQSQEQESESDQDLFESQQAEVEDLLAASLNLAVEQAYLDVHYRSTNADLIEFSNANFYDSRLQPIPAHPSAKAALPPLRMLRVGGVYDKRANLREAEEVVKLVQQLLSSEQPPSIGIACFNQTQRDAIVTALDRAAADDAKFAGNLAQARARKGEASFEGLFVRNLENVQGDERDHIIISTTYGPDPRGRFYRRFGPLGQAGGGRRLNVLVTRARSVVHLITSIPRDSYLSPASLPPGKSPNGGWLLFSYLAYAEHLERLYGEEYDQSVSIRPTQVCSELLETHYPSELASALGSHLCEAHGMSSWVHWGNDGFSVDTALMHPERPGDVTIGVLCDGSRFGKAADLVQWDIFRTEVLESQRWRLVRIWSPQFFRNPAGTIARIKKAVEDWLKQEAEERALKKKETTRGAKWLN